MRFDLHWYQAIVIVFSTICGVFHNPFHCNIQLIREVIKKATANLKLEVATMNQYVMGDVYGFQLIKKEGEEEIIIDSCSGFYGENPSKNGMLDYIKEEIIPENLIF